MLDILILEDDHLLLATMKRVLGGRGFTVAGAQSAEECVALARKHQFALVVADYFLPDVRGDDVLADIREIQPNATLALLTGSAPDSIGTAVDFVFEKPCPVARLVEVIEEARERCVAASEADRPSRSALDNPAHLGGAAFAKPCAG